VVERHEARAFQQQRIERIAAERAVERAGIGAHIRVGRTERGDVGVAEDILDRAIRMPRRQNRRVHVVGPAAHRHAALVRRGDKSRERVLFIHEVGDVGLDFQPREACRIGPEEHAAAHVQDATARVVRQHIARVVIVARHRQRIGAGEVAHPVDDAVVALVDEVVGEQDDRGAHVSAAPARDGSRRRA
jgi:hypothetical protein